MIYNKFIAHAIPLFHIIDNNIIAIEIEDHADLEQTLVSNIISVSIEHIIWLEHEINNPKILFVEHDLSTTLGQIIVGGKIYDRSISHIISFRSEGVRVKEGIIYHSIGITDYINIRMLVWD